MGHTSHASSGMGLASGSRVVGKLALRRSVSMTFRHRGFKNLLCKAELFGRRWASVSRED